ncbi:MAG: hypothetical protein A2V75_00340 [Actinobacteria bacterium RBG_16_70_17]|nr:MAG: hypothetical protein A2V75_00340 [Actinobacteria bacterium RBG_16_70_17]
MTQAMPPPPPPPPAPPAAAKRGAEAWVYWVIGALLVALVVVVVVLVAGGGDKEAATTTAGLGETPGEVYLEPVRTLGPDPYTTEVMEAAVVSTTAPIVSTTISTSTSTSTPTSTTLAGLSTTTTQPVLALQSRTGGEPGLYGGTLDQTRCDKQAILSFLQGNPDKAAAWVAAQNSDPTLAWDNGRTDLTVADLPAYFAELTPVTLIYDTRVTNHGFRDGLPTARQSVLEAGTAVLIDIYGVPRARCACGNPLIPPIPTSGPPGWVGPGWPGFDPTIIVVVVPNPVVITQVIIIDLNTGDLIERPPGGGQDTVVTTTTTTTVPQTTTTLTVPEDVVVGSGDVQVTLLWAHDSDMDLHVIDPDGAEIYYSARTSASGGQLDVDDIPSDGDMSTHVENIFWPPDGAPPGTYSAFVKNYSMGAAGSGSYTMEVRVGGQLIHQETGSIADGEFSPPFEFVVEDG